MQYWHRQRKDYRFGVARREPIDPAYKELARALLAEDANADQLVLLQQVRKLSINRRKSRGNTGPYLHIRHEDGRTDKIVVIDGAYWESTKIDAVPGQLPEDNVDALIYLHGYARRAVLQTSAETEPGDVPVATVLDEYIKAHKPDMDIFGTKMKGLLKKEKTGAMGDPMKWWRVQKNAVNQLEEYFNGKTLGDIGRDSGKDYKVWRQKRPKLSGGRDENGDPIGPKDTTIQLQLSTLQRAIKWFLDNCKAHNIRAEFEMPDFDKVDPYSLAWKALITAVLVCRGLVPDGDGFKMKTVLLNGVARQVWIKDWIADRDSMRAVERYIKIYFLTGTRDKSIVEMTWSESDWHGWIDASTGYICRNGKKSLRHREKPRETSELLPFVTGMFRQWRRDDAKRRNDGVLPPLDPKKPNDFIMYDTCGNPLDGKIQALARKVFERAGISTTRLHPLKHTGVTVHYKRGFSCAQIGTLFGTEEKSIKNSYLNFNWGADRISPEATRNIKSLADLGGRIAPFRRIAVEG